MNRSQILIWALAMSLCTATPAWAQAKAKADIAPPAKSHKKDNDVPQAAWVLESVSITLAAAGFITAVIGATFLNRRDQLMDALTAESPFPGFAPEIPSAKEIKELQDTGFPLLYIGLVVAGVGVVGAVIGGVWLLSHRPKTAPLPDNAKAQAPAPTGPAQVLLRAGH